MVRPVVESAGGWREHTSLLAGVVAVQLLLLHRCIESERVRKNN